MNGKKKILFIFMACLTIANAASMFDKIFGTSALESKKSSDKAGVVKEKRMITKRQIPMAGALDTSLMDYAAYDYYDWVCSGNQCQLCDVLTGACCIPYLDNNCFLPDSCANNPCLSGGTCIPTTTVGGQYDFVCVCQRGLTGKYCQLIDEFTPPIVAALPIGGAIVPSPPPPPATTPPPYGYAAPTYGYGAAAPAAAAPAPAAPVAAAPAPAAPVAAAPAAAAPAAPSTMLGMSSFSNPMGSMFGAGAGAGAGLANPMGSMFGAGAGAGAGAGFGNPMASMFGAGAGAGTGFGMGNGLGTGFGMGNGLGTGFGTGAATGFGNTMGSGFGMGK